jgi:CysZ protein
MASTVTAGRRTRVRLRGAVAHGYDERMDPASADTGIRAALGPTPTGAKREAERGSGREPTRTSFFDGISAPFAGALFIVRRPRSWPAASVPVLFAVLLAGVLIGLSFDWAGPALSELLLPDAQGGLERAAKGTLRWLGSAAAAFLSVLVAVALAPTLSAPALEHLVRLQESALGATPRPARGYWFELRCELEAQLWAWAVLIPFAVVLWVLGALVPVLVPLLAPLNALLVSLAVAWNLLGYPLTLRGMRARARLSLMGENVFAVLGFGAAFAAASIVPGAALLLLPAGVVGATRLTERMTTAASGPGERPSLGR